MKKFFLLLMFVFISRPVHLQNDITFPQFLQEVGMQMMAQCAHMATVYYPEKSTFTLYHDVIHFDIFYEAGQRTRLNVTIENGIMTKTEVFSESHWFPTFGSVRLLNTFVQVSEEELNKNKTLMQILTYYQNLYQKPYKEFNGTEITTAIMSYNWAVYAMEAYNNYQEDPIPQVSDKTTEQTMDGIRIIGPRPFIDRIIQALELIKEVDPGIYNSYFSSADNGPGLIKGIFLGEPGQGYSTNRGDGYLDISNIHGQRYSSNLTETNKYVMAGLLLHEMAHLYQYYKYQELFRCNQRIYRASYFHDPIQIAKVERQAYNTSISFYDTMLKAGATNPLIKIAKQEAEQKKKSYDLVWDAGYYIFESRNPEPECGNDCGRLACEKLAAFQKIYDSKAPNVAYLQWFYRCR